MAHLHKVYDSDTHFKIDATSRIVINESDIKKIMLIQNDHNSERFTFELPRYIEEHDMTLCDVVEIHYINTDSKTKESMKDVYIVDDLQVYPDDENVVVLSWLLSRNATKYVGNLSFLICFKCLDGTEIEYMWSTAIYSKITVGTSIYNSEQVVEIYSDVLEAWKNDILNVAGDAEALVGKTVSDYMTENPVVVEMQATDETIQYSMDGEEWKDIIPISDLKGEKGDTGEQGIQGESGIDGISPTVTIEQLENAAKIVATDVNGTTEAIISGGSAGDAGKSAYETAQEGGYSGTEEEFATSLASIDGHMSKTDPSGTGSFSMNRMAGSTVGIRSSTFGFNNTSSGPQSHAEGMMTTAGGDASHAEGMNSKANGKYSHAEGMGTTADGESSHAEGMNTTAKGDYQHVQGKFNIEDTENTYAHIVGNGNGTTRSNAHTLDWNGNAWFAGDVKATDSEGNEVSLVDLASNAGSGDYMSATDPVGTGSFSMGRKEGSTVGTGSVAIGSECTASGNYSCAFGKSASATGYCAVGIGDTVDASGSYSFATGQLTHARSINSTAHGFGSDATGQWSFATGVNARATSNAATAIGYNTKASGKFSYAEGCYTKAAGNSQHVQGKYNIEDTKNTYAHIVGNGKSDSACSNAHTLDWNGNAWFAGDVKATDSEGNEVSLVNLASNAGGSGEYLTIENPTGTGSFSMNRAANTTVGENSSVLGENCIATGAASHAEGYGCQATYAYAHAEGRNTHAEMTQAHAEGYGTYAKGLCSHAEGCETQANSNYTHAEGLKTTAGMSASHAEGESTTTWGDAAHAEGYSTYAQNKASHAEGIGTMAIQEAQHAQGKYNIADYENKYAHIVGNGQSGDAPSNAHTLDWNGNAWFAGDVTATDKNGNEVSLLGMSNQTIIAINDAAMSKTAIGPIIELTDSAELPFAKFKIYGASSQDGVPTPSSPIDITNVSDGGNVDIYLCDGVTDDEGNSPDVTSTLTVAVTEGLRGIPVTSGGNYTDANGQQWICDEIDLNRGVYIQRVYNYTLDGNITYAAGSSDDVYVVTLPQEAKATESTETAPGLCSFLTNTVPTSDGNCSISKNSMYIVITSGTLTTQDTLKTWLTDNPQNVVYALETPIERTLTGDEITAYKALTTYNPNTTITNSVDADMEVDYITKQYESAVKLMMAGSLTPADVVEIVNDNALTSNDIVNNLTSTATNVPLSAYQGKLLNDKIDSAGGGSWTLIFDNVTNKTADLSNYTEIRVTVTGKSEDSVCAYTISHDFFIDDIVAQESPFCNIPGYYRSQTDFASAFVDCYPTSSKRAFGVGYVDARFGGEFDSDATFKLYAK